MTLGDFFYKLPFLLFILGGGYLLTMLRLPQDWTAAHVLLLLVLPLLFYVFFVWQIVARILTSVTHVFEGENVITIRSLYGVTRCRFRSRNDVKAIELVDSRGGAHGGDGFWLFIKFKDGTTETLYRNNSNQDVQNVKKSVEEFLATSMPQAE